MQKTPASYLPLLQQPISDLGPLSSGIEELEKLFRQLKQGHLVFFHGSMFSHVLSEFVCVLSLLRHVEEGSDSSVIFVDGGNIFDPYLISEVARFFGLDAEETLKKIWVSRAFTAYQLTALITEKLPEVLEREGSKLVVVSDIAALYCNPDIGMLEAKTTFNRVTLFLWNLVRENNLLLVTTSLSSGGGRKQRLEQYLQGRADISAKVEAGNPHVKIILEKHLSNSTATVNLSFSEPSSQPLLEDFMEV